LARLAVALWCAAGWAAAAAGQSMDVPPVTCLSADEARRFAEELAALMKKEGLYDPSSEIGTMLKEAMDRQNAADACSQKAGDAAPQRCRAELAAAEASNQKLESLNARMEKLHESMLAIRARYRRC
jgi:hypothetical protein